MSARFQNWFSKNIWDLTKKSSGTTFDLKGTEAASKFFGFTENFTEEVITERRAHGLAAVYTCLNVRAQTISALPINIYQENGGKKTNLTEHSAYYPLAHQPNTLMSSANFFLTSMIHSDSWGNSYAYINRDFKQRAVSFDLLCPWDVEHTVSGGELFYRYNGEIIPARDMLHFRWFSYDGVCGISPIRLNANTFGMNLKEDRYSAYALGQKPPGILTYDGHISPEQQKQNQKSWKTDLVSGNTPILSGNWKFQPVMIPPQDAEYISSKKLTKQEIYGIFRIPPTFAQDFERATFANAEQQDLVFVKHTITPIVRMIEQELNMKIFSEKEKKNTYVKFNLNGLLRGDLAARQAFYQAMVNTGVYNRNEVRSLEDLNAYESGDDFLVQGAMVPADMLRKQMESKLIPTAPAKPLNGTEKNGYNYTVN